MKSRAIMVAMMLIAMPCFAGVDLRMSSSPIIKQVYEKMNERGDGIVDVPVFAYLLGVSKESLRRDLERYGFSKLDYDERVYEPPPGASIHSGSVPVNEAE